MYLVLRDLFVAEEGLLKTMPPFADFICFGIQTGSYGNGKMQKKGVKGG